MRPRITHFLQVIAYPAREEPTSAGNGPGAGREHRECSSVGQLQSRRDGVKVKEGRSPPIAIGGLGTSNLEWEIVAR